MRGAIEDEADKALRGTADPAPQGGRLAPPWCELHALFSFSESPITIFAPLAQSTWNPCAISVSVAAVRTAFWSVELGRESTSPSSRYNRCRRPHRRNVCCKQGSKLET